MDEKACLLCGSSAELFFTDAPKKYYRCKECLGIFLDPACRLSKEEEHARYLEHNNDVEDPAYQKFVDPIVSEIRQRFGRGHQGLDYGAGPGPVIAKRLRDEGYAIELYDPFFWNDRKKLEGKYDFIACCEVIEHFHAPAKEFKQLRSLLNPGGALFCMTELYSEEVDFKTWYYRNDPTHVFFFHRKTLERVRSDFDFYDLKTKGRLVQFAI
jgi:SAM-dependent methyltransferase